MTKYYLKDHITDDMLQAVGYRFVFDKDIKAFGVSGLLKTTTLN